LDVTPLETPEPELAYLFKHIITREVAYQGMATVTRAELHERYARYLEQAPGAAALSTWLDVLAYHYGLTNNLDKQREYWRKAGLAAAARFANIEAVDHFSRALAITPQGAARFELLLARVKVYDLQGARAVEQADLAELAQLAEMLGDRRRRAEVLLQEMFHAFYTSDYVACVDRAQRVVALTEDVGAPDLAMTAHQQWAWAHIRLGEYDRALPQGEASLALARANGDRRGEGQALRTLGAAAWYRGDYPVARVYFEQGLSVAHEVGDLQNEGLLYGNLGSLASSQGDLIGSRAFFGECLRVCRAIGDRQHAAWALNGLGMASARLGDYTAGRDYHRESLELRRAIGDRWGECWALLGLGWCYADLGEAAAARTHYEQAADLAHVIGDRRNEASALYSLGDLVLTGGALAEAEECLRRSLMIRENLGNPLAIAESRTGLARLALVRHDADEALVQVDEILHAIEAGRLAAGDLTCTMRLTCYRVLRAAGDARAAPVLAAAVAWLREQAARIPDAEARRMFLENVACHRELLALAA
jgi:tetratricopeptide (TPR) repeat protein